MPKPKPKKRPPTWIVCESPDSTVGLRADQVAAWRVKGRREGAYSVGLELRSGEAHVFDGLSRETVRAYLGALGVTVDGEQLSALLPDESEAAQ